MTEPDSGPGSPAMSPAIRTESDADHASVREVNRRAFGRDAEADLVDALRDGGHARLSLVAAAGDAGDSGAVVGHILFSRLTVEDGPASPRRWPSPRWRSCRGASGGASARPWSARG